MSSKGGGGAVSEVTFQMWGKSTGFQVWHYGPWAYHDVIMRPEPEGKGGDGRVGGCRIQFRELSEQEQTNQQPVGYLVPGSSGLSWQLAPVSSSVGLRWAGANCVLLKCKTKVQRDYRL